jgi:hypothetical protein
VGAVWIPILAALLALLAIVGVVCAVIAWRRRQEIAPAPNEVTQDESFVITDFNPANELDFENPLASDEELGSGFAARSDEADLNEEDLDESRTVLL